MTIARTQTAARSLGVAGVALAALLSSGTASAQKVYKSVDAEGNISYTDQAPTSDFVDAHRFELPPDLTAEQRAAAADEREKVMRAADLEGTRRPPRATPAEIREAERRLGEARRRLENYEVVRDDDWGGTQQGKRTLKPAYFARVDAAKRQLAEARAELDHLRKQGR